MLVCSLNCLIPLHRAVDSTIQAHFVSSVCITLLHEVTNKFASPSLCEVVKLFYVSYHTTSVKVNYQSASSIVVRSFDMVPIPYSELIDLEIEVSI